MSIIPKGTSCTVIRYDLPSRTLELLSASETTRDLNTKNLWPLNLADCRMVRGNNITSEFRSLVGDMHRFERGYTITISGSLWYLLILK